MPRSKINTSLKISGAMSLLVHNDTTNILNKVKYGNGNKEVAVVKLKKIKT